MPDFSTLPFKNAGDMAGNTAILVVLAADPTGGQTDLSELAKLILGVGCGPLAAGASILVDAAAAVSVNWESRNLVDHNSAPSLDWDLRHWINAFGNVIADFSGFGFLFYDNAGNIVMNVAARSIIDVLGFNVLEFNDPTVINVGQNGGGVINIQGGVITVPNMLTADPADGQHKLWYDTTTRIVMVGT